MQTAPSLPRSPHPTPAALNLATVLATIDRHSCPHHYNFHLHTHCSDGQMHPRALLDQAIAQGLQGVAITDHHTLAGYHAAQAYRQTLQNQPQSPALAQPSASATPAPAASPAGSAPDRPPAPLPQLWSGIEITAKLLGVAVHILGYGFDVEDPGLAPYQTGTDVDASGQPFAAADVIAALQGAGGLAVLAHPVRYRKPPEVLIPAAAALGIDGVETFYAYDNPVPWRPSVAQTDRVQQLGHAYGLLQTCGTDSHGPSLLQRL